MHILPALVAKYLLEDSDRKAINEILNIHLGLLMPEVLVKPVTLTKWSKFFKGKGASQAGDIVVHKQYYYVDKNFIAGDEMTGVLVNGKYKLNPTATRIEDLTINPSGVIKGKKWLDKQEKTVELLNGKEYMYVIDEADNLIIGTRAKHTDFSDPVGKAPHPTLIGGSNPAVQAAGTIEFRGGKIFKVDNGSGHFKPPKESLIKAEEVFRKIFPENSFDKNFKGFIEYGN